MKRRVQRTKTYVVPDYSREWRRIRAIGDEWEYKKKYLQLLLRSLGRQTAQSLIPEKELRIPWLGKKDRVFVFAGSTADVSSMIPNQRRMVHSDHTESRTILAKRLNLPEESRKSVIRADATRLPLKKRSVDWLVSYEPTPLGSRSYIFPQAITRTKKGVILAGAFSPNHNPEIFGFRKPAKIYGARMNFAQEEVSYVGGIKRTMYYTVIKTNPGTQKKADIDARLMDLLNSKRRNMTRGALEEMRHKLGLSQKDFRDSLRRITKLVEASRNAISFGVNY